MQDSINWKDRYSQLLSECERDSLTRQQHSKALQRLLARAILAAEGQDPQLDKVLYNTRKNLAQLTAKDATRLAEDLEQAMLAAEQRQHQRLDSLQHSLLAMCEQLLQLRPADKLRKSLINYSNTLGRTTTANHLLAQQLSNYSQLQQQVLRAEGNCGNNNADDSFDQTSRQIQTTLLQLLDRFPDNSARQHQLKQLRERIGQNYSYPQLAQILDELSQLMDSLYSSSQEEMKLYLAQLDQRLHQVGENLQQSQGQYQQSIDLAADFDQQMQGQVQSFGTDLQYCDDLELLKRTIDQRMYSFQQTLANYSQQRSAQESDLQGRFAVLQKRLHQMEFQVDKANQLLAQQQQRSMLDQLTGIANRAAWDERISQEHARMQRSNEPLCLAIIDIDFFKKVTTAMVMPPVTRCSKFLPAESAKTSAIAIFLPAMAAKNLSC